jgi:short subunit dehydrogenase-like uncharacterized protein
MSDRQDREFDIVLWGATGFAGRLVAEYFAANYGEDELRWALGGRNRAKLEVVRDELMHEFGQAAKVPLVIADATDRASLDEMAGRTRVVCTTVGPYDKYGSKLVAACVDKQTDYCDLTGEVHWIREMIDAHHDQASENKTRIVNCCGFDSIPSDLGTLMVQDFAKREFGAPCRQNKMFLMGAKGGFSGGTLDSMSNLMERLGKEPELRRVVGHPYSLNPEGEQSGPDGSTQASVRHDKKADLWTAPFIMARINEKIVRRSNAVLDYPYGRDFSYEETTSTGKGVTGALRAAGLTAGLGAFAGLMALTPTRNLLREYVLPSPGEGPSREAIESGFFRVKHLGRGISEAGEAFEVEATIAADSDPGYGATALMLAESALCLAFDECDDCAEGGILTPASAMGMALVDRLREAGMTMDVSRR